jgi:hypothetical protein
MRENDKFREAYEAVRGIIFNEPLDLGEIDILTNALGVLYSRLPEAH